MAKRYHKDTLHGVTVWPELDPLIRTDVRLVKAWDAYAAQMRRYTDLLPSDLSEIPGAKVVSHVTVGDVPAGTFPDPGPQTTLDEATLDLFFSFLRNELFSQKGADAPADASTAFFLWKRAVSIYPAAKLKALADIRQALKKRIAHHKAITV